MTDLQSARFCGGARLDLAPLEQALASRCIVDTAEKLGVDRRQVQRWRRSGVSWAQADILAIRAGVHPSAVWGRSWWALSDEPEHE